MEKQHIEKQFEKLEGSFDYKEPRDGHKERFVAKLQASIESTPNQKHKKRGLWWKSLSLAAALLLLFTLGLNFFNPSPTVQQQVTKISPEITNTENYFANVIEEQVNKMKGESTPETQKLISDTMIQLRTLDSDYKKMEQDLLNGGNSKLILGAMITNFQTRIDLLNEVIKQIEEIKILKNYKNENNPI